LSKPSNSSNIPANAAGDCKLFNALLLISLVAALRLQNAQFFSHKPMDIGQVLPNQHECRLVGTYKTSMSLEM
jgi:hypothetical protein